MRVNEGVFLLLLFLFVFCLFVVVLLLFFVLFLCACPYAVFRVLVPCSFFCFLFCFSFLLPGTENQCFQILMTIKDSLNCIIFKGLEEADVM